jgi:hypothetical protein
MLMLIGFNGGIFISNDGQLRNRKLLDVSAPLSRFGYKSMVAKYFELSYRGASRLLQKRLT